MSSNPERERFLRHLRQRGLRLTRERTALFDEIFSQHGHLDAEALLRSMKSRGIKTSRATVYRNLKAMVEEGELRPVELPGQPDRYEPAGKAHHHHFHCRRCDGVFEVDGCPAGVKALAPRGFRLEGHDLTLFGVCNRCAR